MALQVSLTHCVLCPDLLYSAGLLGRETGPSQVFSLHKQHNKARGAGAHP